MQNRPTAAELLETVRELISSELMPLAQDDGLRFRLLIASNLLAIVGREINAGGVLTHDELARLRELLPDLPLDPKWTERETILKFNEALARQIRDAAPDSSTVAVHSPLWEHAKRTLRDQLTVSNPKFDLDY